MTLYIHIQLSADFTLFTGLAVKNKLNWKMLNQDQIEKAH